MSEPSSSVEEHRKASHPSVRFMVLTISDSRDLANDRSGDIIIELMTSKHHTLTGRSIVRDEIDEIKFAVLNACQQGDCDVVITTGGTGIAPRDRTPEAIEPLLEVHLPGFGEIFRMLSYQQIGAASMLSRAFAGRIGSVLVFCLPGSTNAVRLATEVLIAGEIHHLVHHSRPK